MHVCYNQSPMPSPAASSIPYLIHSTGTVPCIYACIEQPSRTILDLGYPYFEQRVGVESTSPTYSILDQTLATSKGCMYYASPRYFAALQ